MPAPHRAGFPSVFAEVAVVLKERLTLWSWMLSPRIITWTIVLVLTVLVVLYLLWSHYHHVI